MKLRENARLYPAIRMRRATVFAALLVSAAVFLIASRATFAFGNPQSSHGHQECVTPAAAEAYLRSSSSCRSAEEASPLGQTVFPTHESLRLTLKADCANIEVFTDASNDVSYSVRLDPKIAGPTAEVLRRSFLLAARNTPSGVVLLAPAATEVDCRFPVSHAIHVPRRYSLNIAVRFGNIVSQDIDGLVTLATGGGNIEVGSVGPDDGNSRIPARKAFSVQLETAGGDISVGDVAGGLRAATAGGKISAHDVHGPAVLRTGGGDIHVGHVFGPAHFASGGGDITARKIDGGLWADTAGGRIEIGNAARGTAFDPQFPSASNDPSLAAVPPSPEEQKEMFAISALADVTRFSRFFDPLVWGGIRVAPADQQKRLVTAISPEYPDVARWAGIEGEVILRIFISPEGRVRAIVPLSGPPVLARAAVRAVEEWRYAPAVVDGHPVDVVSSVTLAFRLRP